MEKEKVELLPCPFCGSVPKLWVRDAYFKAKYAIGCEKQLCLLWIPSDTTNLNLVNYAPCFVKKQHAIDCWNTRADSKRIGELESEAKRLREEIGFVRNVLGIKNTSVFLRGKYISEGDYDAKQLAKQIIQSGAGEV